MLSMWVGTRAFSKMKPRGVATLQDYASRYASAGPRKKSSDSSSSSSSSSSDSDTSTTELESEEEEIPDVPRSFEDWVLLV